MGPHGLGWRSIFLINVPIGLVTVALARRHVPETRGEPARLDLVGAGLLTIAMVTIVLPLVEGRQQGWPTWTFVSLAASALVATAFVTHQARLANRGGQPLVDLALFGQRAFSAGLGTCVAFFVANGSFFLFLAIFLQEGRRLSALDSGLIFLALGAGFFAALLTAGPLAAKLGRQVLAVGALATGAGYALLALTVAQLPSSASIAWIAPGLLVTGVGLGLVLVPLTDIVLAGIPPRHAGTAAGVLGTAQQLGGALGVAVLGIVYYGALDGTQASAHTHAFTLSLLVLAGFTLLAAVLVQLLPRPHRRPGN